MSEPTGFDINPEALIALHNELADELNTEKDRLSLLKSGRELEEVTGDPSLNYLQGKVLGFEVAMNALRAFIEARTADASGRLNPEQATETDT